MKTKIGLKRKAVGFKLFIRDGKMFKVDFKVILGLVGKREHLIVNY